MQSLTIYPMDESAALQIASWRYSAPYYIYDMDGSAETLAELLGGSYFAAFQDGVLLRFFCFGSAARIPTQEENVYAEGFLDLGLGMNPCGCGRGTGLAFIQEGMRFAKGLPGYTGAFRLTVAVFNLRAKTVYERAGFIETRCVHHLRSGSPFFIMQR